MLKVNQAAWQDQIKRQLFLDLGMYVEDQLAQYNRELKCGYKRFLRQKKAILRLNRDGKEVRA